MWDKYFSFSPLIYKKAILFTASCLSLVSVDFKIKGHEKYQSQCFSPFLGQPLATVHETI